jgi:hypothetical protein
VFFGTLAFRFVLALVLVLVLVIGLEVGVGVREASFAMAVATSFSKNFLDGSEHATTEYVLASSFEHSFFAGLKLGVARSRIICIKGWL